jgi:hypothetical protein
VFRSAIHAQGQAPFVSITFPRRRSVGGLHGLMRNPLDTHTREGATHAKEHNKPERRGNKCERDLGWSHENVKAKNVDEHRAEQPIWSLSNAFTSSFKELDAFPVQGDGEAGRIYRDAVLTIILT